MNLRNQLLAVLENTERPTREVRNVRVYFKTRERIQFLAIDAFPETAACPTLRSLATTWVGEDTGRLIPEPPTLIIVTLDGPSVSRDVTLHGAGGTHGPVNGSPVTDPL